MPTSMACEGFRCVPVLARQARGWLSKRSYLEPLMIPRIASFAACLLAFVALPTQAPNTGYLAATEGSHALESALQGAKAGGQAGKPGSGFATLTTLPSLGAGSEALAVNATGTVVVGTAWDRSDLLHAVRWTLQNGTWVISSMPWPPGASSAAARGVNNAGDAAGSSYPASNSRALLWPAAGRSACSAALPIPAASMKPCMPSVRTLRWSPASEEEERLSGSRAAAGRTSRRCSREVPQVARSPSTVPARS